jgi:hypothetical protein
MLAISGGLAKSLKPRRLNTELVQFMDEDFENFDSQATTVHDLAYKKTAFEEQDGLGAMRNFAAEKGYRPHNAAEEVAHDEHIDLESRRLDLPFTLYDLQEHKGPETVSDKENAGVGYIERADGIDEVNMVQVSGINVD